MAGEVFRIVGVASGEQYASLCMPDADDYHAVFALNTLFDIARQYDKWAKTEKLIIEIAHPKAVEQAIMPDSYYEAFNAGQDIVE